MALPSSGQISMDDIRVELGVPSQSPFGLDEARLGTYVAINQFSASKPPSSGQVSLSDWYSYCQNCGYNSGTFFYSNTSAAAACAGTPDTTLYWSGAIGIGTILYTDSLGTSEASQGYWSDDTDAYFQNCPDGCYDGITSITACVETATLSWTYSETGGANAEMRIYVNSVAVETRTNTSSGTWTGLETGDEIYVEIELLGACSGNDDAGNVYTQSSKGTLVDAACFVASTGTLTTSTYTVIAGDLGTTITLDTYASCDSGCL
jgi:hypothetical protein